MRRGIGEGGPRRRARWPWLAGAVVVALGGVATYLASGLPAPSQPIRFSHLDHAKQVECSACHAYAATLRSAGTPTLADCMACHEAPQSGTPDGKGEEAKLQAYAKAQKEIPWVTITPPLAPHTFFSHRRHVELAKVECATCHGKIAETVALPVRPAVSFSMDFCVACHEKRQASVDCLACHK